MRPIDYETLFEDGRSAGAEEVIHYIEDKMFYIPEALKDDINAGVLYRCVEHWLKDCKDKWHVRG